MAQYDVTTSNASFKFSGQAGQNQDMIQVDSNHFFTVFTGDLNDGFAQVLTISTSTWAVTTATTELEFDTTNAATPIAVSIDTNHFLVSWTPTGNYLRTQTFAVNTTTWAVTTAGAVLDVGALGWWPATCKVDATHFLTMAGQGGSKTSAWTVTVNTTTWAVATSSAIFDISTTTVSSGNSVVMIDTNHALAIWADAGNDGFAQVLTVNTTTWAVTTAAARLEFDPVNALTNYLMKLDATHFINIYEGNGGGFVVALAVDTSTWAVTTAGAAFNYAYGPNSGTKGYVYDSTHFIVSGQDGNNDGFSMPMTVNTSTWAITTTNAGLEYDTQFSFYGNAKGIDSNHFLTMWTGGASGSDLLAQVMYIEYTPPPTIKTINGLAKASVKTWNGVH